MALSENSAAAPPEEPPLDDWATAVRAVLDGKGLRIAAQPIVDVATGAIAGYEMLARFSGPPVAGPDIWFERAELLGLGAELDATVVRRVLDVRTTLPPNCFLTLNIIPTHLANPSLRQAFTDAGTLEGVVVELTEQSVIDDYEAVIGWLAPLRTAGAKIAIDDAGSGYAGLQWLMRLHPDLIKLDRALVDHMDEDEVKLALVEMLGTFTDRIDAWLLAEGIERQAEFDVARRLGIPLAQGYLMARPSTDLWPRVDPIVARHPARAAGADPRCVGWLVEAVVTRPADAAQSPDTVCVAIDGMDRPLCIDIPGHGPADVMVLRPDDEVRSALLRALARPAPVRWHPLVCVDEIRRTLGIVRMERLVEAVATPSRAEVP